MPISLLGALYYAFIILGVVAYFDTKRVGILTFIRYITASGFLVSLYLVYLQLFVIKAICLYCIGSAATSIFLFIIGVIVLKNLSKQDTITEQETRNT